MSRLKIPTHTHHLRQQLAGVAIDTIGPLSEDVDRHRYVIVIIDCFSRYPKLYPAKSVDAVSAVKPLLQWVGTFGPPSFSDHQWQWFSICESIDW